MATFIKASEVYDAPAKRLQNDIEIVGATITRSNGRITKIEFSGGAGGGGAMTAQSPDGSTWTLGVTDLGQTSWSKP